MIVFLDIERKQLTIYTDTGSHSLGFNNVEAIKQIIGERKVLYITGAVETNGNDVMDVVKEVAKKVGMTSAKNETPAFLRTTLKGYFCMNIEDKELLLKGPIHFYPLKNLYETFGKDVFEKCKPLGQMLREGKLQIITQSQSEAIKKGHINDSQKKQDLIDSVLDDILVDGKVDDYLGGYDNDSIPGSHDDIIEIDVKAGGSGGSSNEGSLVPNDFEG